MCALGLPRGALQLVPWWNCSPPLCEVRVCLSSKKLAKKATVSVLAVLGVSFSAYFPVGVESRIPLPLWFFKLFGWTKGRSSERGRERDRADGSWKQGRKQTDGVTAQPGRCKEECIAETFQVPTCSVPDLPNEAQQSPRTSPETGGGSTSAPRARGQQTPLDFSPAQERKIERGEREREPSRKDTG